ncbi:MAG: GAF domain-containing protein, partial [Acidobacteria bacterium]|nr:GAF domain-containing protein [Acidobacteriota bacterium]
MAEAKTNKKAPAISGVSQWSRLPEELKKLDGSYDLVRLLQHLLRLLQKVGPDYAAGIFLLDEETRTIQGQVTDLFDRDLHTGEGALLAALRNPASFMISSLPNPGGLPVASGSARSQILVPFRASPHVRGALILRSSQTDAFLPQDGQVLSEFALLASALIESALIHQKLVRVGEEEVERDMVMAQEIMARLIPRKPPQIAGFDVASIH